MARVRTAKVSRVCQGDIYRNVEMIEYVSEVGGVIEVSKVEFPLVVVLAQDCDLEQDKKFRSRKAAKSQDKLLISLLVAPLYNLEHVFAGEHLSSIGLTMEPINRRRTPGKNLVQNETPRYHTLRFPLNQPIVDSVVDFKHYFSVNINYLNRLRTKNFVCRLAPLFREDLSQRFAGYLARIGLP